MKFKAFTDFIDKKQREANKQLGLIEQLLKKKGFKTENYIYRENNDDAYVYVKNPFHDTSFDGVRIYKIGETIAFRIQRESDTHPYGSAYALDVEQMFEDLMQEEDVSELQAGKLIIEAVAKQLNCFFKKSKEVESEDRAGTVINGEDTVRSTGRDYGSLIYSNT